MKKFISKPCWLLHHGILLEWTTEPVKNRIDYIKSDKPENEIPTRLKWFRPVQHPELLPDAVKKAYADRQKADADWQKAYADLQKAYADLQKAYADRQKADADWQKAYEDWQKAYEDWQKAYADRQRAYADRQRAYVDLQNVIQNNLPAIIQLHKKECPGCPFDYEKWTLIFPEPSPAK